MTDLEATADLIEHVIGALRGDSQTVLEPVVQWGYGNDMAIHAADDQESAELAVREWNDRAATLSREAGGRASYPRAFLYARTPAVPAGKWEAIS